MTTDKELKKKLSIKKANLLELCGDSKEAVELLDEILSLKGQIDVEPARLHIPEKDVIDEYKGASFCLTKTKKSILYHLYGGYTIVVDEPIRGASFSDNEKEALFRGFPSLYDTLDYYFNSKDEYDRMSAEDKELFQLVLTAENYILSLPTYVFADENFMFDIANKCVTFLKDSLTKAVKAVEENGLPDEDEKANAMFEQAVRDSEQKPV